MRAENADQSGQFGGIGGGKDRSSGSVGSTARGRMSRSPGNPNESRLGPPLGASGTVDFEAAGGSPLRFSGRRFGATVLPQQPGPRRGEPGSEGARRVEDRIARDRQRVSPPEFDESTLSQRPLLELPAQGEDPGPPDGLTLDAAIGLLLARNLDFLAQKFEVPKALADILTASLRNNPIVNADAQLVPYGHYTNLSPGGGGGQPQYDVNFSIPVDITRKRKARVDVATRARAVTEAQLQDSARILIDDLYGAYVNVLAARETLRYSEAFLDGMAAILVQAERGKGDEEKREEAEERQSARIVLKDQVTQARFQVRRATQTLARTKRRLAELLDLPPDRAEGVQLRGLLRQPAPAPPPSTTLSQQALCQRPDVIAYRLGVGRAKAEVGLARANRASDAYLVYQPYTFQDNAAFGLKGTHSYAVGINAALPMFNRNQGNIARAEANARQTEVELRARERQVVHEVDEAARSLELSAAGLLDLESDVLPASRRSRDDAYRQYRDDPSKVNDFVDKQREYNEVVQEYRNALIEHRQDMLELNTAVGARIMP